jgi:hypothetical protein
VYTWDQDSVKTIKAQAAMAIAARGKYPERVLKACGFSTGFEKVEI